MDNLKDSFVNVVKDRLNNSLIGTFVIYWLIFHWRFVFSLVFLDQESILMRTSLLKDDYLMLKYFNTHDICFWFWLLMPFLFTYITIWKLPELLFMKAHRKNEEYETQKQLITISEMIIIEAKKTELENKKKEKDIAVVERIAQEEIINKSNPKILWEEEYQQIPQERLQMMLRQIIDCVYTHNGFIREGVFSLSTGILSYADAIEIIVKSAPSKIELTEKGRFFVRKFIETTQK